MANDPFQLKRIPVIGDIEGRSPFTSLSKDQLFINVLPYKKTNGVIGVRKRPGMDSFRSAASLSGPVSIVSDNASLAYSLDINGNTGNAILTEVVNNNSVTFGVAIDSLSEWISNCTISGVDYTFVRVSSGVTQYVFYSNGVAATQITDADFPSNTVGALVEMDGQIYVMTLDGKIYNSDLNSVSAWSALSFLTTTASGDRGVSVARYKSRIVGFSTDSIEFYESVGNIDGSPLKVIKEYTISDLGALSMLSANRTVYEANNTVYWIGSAKKNGARGIYQLEDFKATKISNEYIDSLLAIPTPNAIGHGLRISGLVSLFGKQYLIISSIDFSNVPYSMVYCLDDKAWFLWHHGGNKTFKGFVQIDGTIYCVTEDGTMKFNPNSITYRDGGQTVDSTIQLGLFDNDNNANKSCSKLRLLCDKASSTNNMNVQTTDDDYITLSTARAVDLSLAEPTLTGLGAFRRRGHVLTHSSNLDFRLEAIELVFQQRIH